MSSTYRAGTQPLARGRSYERSDERCTTGGQRLNSAEAGICGC
jgi:hypothetical protein